MSATKWLVVCSVVIGVCLGVVGYIVIPRDNDHYSDNSYSSKGQDPTVNRQLVTFSKDSFWYDDITQAPVDPQSKNMVTRLTRTITDNWNGNAAVNISKYNVSYYQVDNTTPKQDMKFNDCQDKGRLDDDFADVLQQVPIPRGAVAADGSDANLTIYNKDTDTLWEFWKAQDDGNGAWSACWGGRLDNAKKSQGIFKGYTGATATGLSFAGGVISIEEAKAGSINHAMYLSIIDVRESSNYSWPAQRSDGFLKDNDAIPEGRRLRLRSDINLDQYNLTPFGRMVAVAAQKHGFVVADKAGAVGIAVESGMPTQRATGVDPWDGITGNTPSYDLLRNFPWEHIEVLPHDYGRS